MRCFRMGVSPLLNKFHERSISVQDGTRKTIQALTFPIKTSKGYMLGSIMRDITERKNARKPWLRATVGSARSWRAYRTVFRCRSRLALYLY